MAVLRRRSPLISFHRSPSRPIGRTRVRQKPYGAAIRRCSMRFLAGYSPPRMALEESLRGTVYRETFPINCEGRLPKPERSRKPNNRSSSKDLSRNINRPLLPVDVKRSRKRAVEEALNPSITRLNRSRFRDRARFLVSSLQHFGRRNTRGDPTGEKIPRLTGTLADGASPGAGERSAKTLPFSAGNVSPADRAHRGLFVFSKRAPAVPRASSLLTRDDHPTTWTTDTLIPDGTRTHAARLGASWLENEARLAEGPARSLRAVTGLTDSRHRVKEPSRTAATHAQERASHGGNERYVARGAGVPKLVPRSTSSASYKPFNRASVRVLHKS